MTFNNSTNKLVGDKAIVVGAGMAGLMTAAALSQFFASVLIIEKDELPNKPAFRKGVPQGWHVHTLLGYGVEASETLFPGLMDQLYAAGAVQIRRNYDIWFHDASGPTPIRDVGILTPSVTRPLLEHITRERVLSFGNVGISTDTRLLTYIAAPGGPVPGVSISRNQTGSIRLDQALFFSHSRSSRISVLTRMISLRIRATRATFAGFPALMRSVYLALRSGLCRMATRAGM